MSDTTYWRNVANEGGRGSTMTACLHAACDALDAQADKLNRLSVRCESQRITIAELEGALREALRLDDAFEDGGVDAMEVRRWREQARAALNVANLPDEIRATR